MEKKKVSDVQSTPKKQKGNIFLSMLCCGPTENEEPKPAKSSMVVNSAKKSQLNKDSTLSSTRDSLVIPTFNRMPSLVNPKNGGMRISYPVNEVFILGFRDKIVAKITKVKVAKSQSTHESFSGTQNPFKGYGNTQGPPKWNETMKELVNYKKEIFALFEKGVKAEEWDQITPEVVARHIATRLECDVIIDALCGYGGNTIQVHQEFVSSFDQFAKTCNLVLAIDIEPSKTFYAKHNAQIYQVADRIDFFTSNFLTIRNLSADVVFLAPSISKPANEEFSLHRHLKPDLKVLLAKALEISNCIAIKLPPETDLDEMAKFFNCALEFYDLYSKRFCIEIEKIYNNDDQVECIFVYFGDCSTITIEEEYEAIYRFIGRNDPSAEWKSATNVSFVQKIIEKVGLRKSFKYISDIEEQKNQYNNSDSLFDRFLAKLIQERIFTQESLDKIKDIESKRRTNKKGAIPSPLTAAFKLDKIENSPTRKVYLGGSSPDSKLMLRAESPKKQSDEASSFGSKLRGVSPFDGTYKNSVDVSELAASSYSVSEGYLDDNTEPLESITPRSGEESDENGRAIRSSSDSSIKNERDENKLASELNNAYVKQMKGSGTAKRNLKDSKGPNRNTAIFRSVNPIFEEISRETRDKSFTLQYEEVE